MRHIGNLLILVVILFTPLCATVIFVKTIDMPVGNDCGRITETGCGPIVGVTGGVWVWL